MPNGTPSKSTALNVTPVEKQILYTNSKRARGIQSTDPFAADPMLASSLLLLASSETLEKIGTVPPLSTSVIASPEETPSLSATPPNIVGRIRPLAEKMADPSFGGRGSILGEAKAISENSPFIPHSLPQDDTVLSEDSSPLPPSSFSLPQSSHTPLIWDALEDRYGKNDAEETERMKRKNLKSFSRNSKRKADLGIK